MIINKLSVTNVGVFGGKHEFLLRPAISVNTPKPITIFGGMNGTGKTTIFDSIKLCLYGQDALPGVSVSDYHKYLKGKIHHSKDTPLQPDHATISIEFEHSKMGETSIYCIERTWIREFGKIKEHLVINRNGVTVDDLEHEYWQEFIKDLVPLGLSQLFFFDGEKIQKMITDDDLEFKNSIKALLGLDLIDRLNADLAIFRSRELQEHATIQQKEDKAAFERELTTIIQNERIIDDVISSLKENIDKKSAEILKYKDKINANGGKYFKTQDSLIEAKQSFEVELEHTKDRIRDLCSGLLPIVFASNFANKLKCQLIKERDQTKNRIIAESLSRKLIDLSEMLTGDDFWGDIDNLLFVKSKLKDHFDYELDSVTAIDNSELIFDFSESQTERLLYDINVALYEVPKQLKILTDDYERTYNSLHQVELNLQKVPEESLIEPMYKKLEELNQELGALRYEMALRFDEKTSIESQKLEKDKKLEQINHKIFESEKTNKKIELTQKAVNVLKIYSSQLAAIKVHHLKDTFTNIFNLLHRKKDMLSRIEIDPNTFQIELYNIQDKRIDKSSLSSGELEIYAISMLWALAKISGQKLPFIIDTPLGRLDTDHRDNLIKEFFPNASPQMIIFSTNTEVDKKYFDELKQHVARAYIFEHDDHTGRSQIKDGYFWG